MCTCIYTCIPEHTCVLVHTNVHLYTRVYLQTHVPLQDMKICRHLRVCSDMCNPPPRTVPCHTNLHPRIHTCTHSHTCTHVYMKLRVRNLWSQGSVWVNSCLSFLSLVPQGQPPNSHHFVPAWKHHGSVPFYDHHGFMPV